MEKKKTIRWKVFEVVSGGQGGQQTSVKCKSDISECSLHSLIYKQINQHKFRSDNKPTRIEQFDGDSRVKTK